MEEADALCQRLAIIDHAGIALGTPAELKAPSPADSCCASLRQPDSGIA